MLKSLLFFFSLSLCIQWGYGQDGTYNHDFATGGTFKMLFPDGIGQGAFFEMNDGTILLKADQFLMKLSADGVLDESYGDNGLFTVDNSVLNGFEILDEHEGQQLLVVVSEIVNGVSEKALVHMDLDGNVDPNFGDNGFLVPFPGPNKYKLYKATEDDTFFAIGLTNINNNIGTLTFKHYLADGSIDTSFGDNGVINLPNSIEVTYLQQFLIDSQGRFIIVANVVLDGIVTSVIIRLNANAEVDSSFGDNGVLTIPLDNTYGIKHVALFATNDFAVCLSEFDPDTTEWTAKLMKVFEDGSLDLAFGGNGEVILANGAAEIIMQHNQRIIYLGADVDWEGGTYLFFERYLSDGTADSTFNHATNFPDPFGPYNVGIRQNGDLTVGGVNIWYQFFNRWAFVISYNNSPLSVTEQSFRNIAVYPNPSEGIFTVETNGLVENLDFEVYDFSGKLLQTGILDYAHTTLDISEVAQGIYFLKIENQTLRLIKE